MVRDLTPQPLQEESFTPNSPWLLVLLTDLKDRCQGRLVSELKETVSRDLWRHDLYYFGKESLVPIDPDNIKVEIWSTSRRLLESIAQQGPQRDSKTNIYALTVFAQRLGYSRLIIADDMTKRQLLGIPRRTHERCTQDLDMDTLLPTRLAGTEGATRCI